MSSNKRPPRGGGGGGAPGRRHGKKPRQQPEPQAPTPPAPKPPSQTNPGSLWVQECRRVGFEFTTPSKQWTRIMAVIRMVCKCHSLDEDSHIELLCAINEIEMKRKKPEQLNWDLEKVMACSIKKGGAGRMHDLMKKEYTKVKATVDKQLMKGTVAQDLNPMAPWRHPSEAWQRGAAFVQAFWKCHPEMSKEEAFREACRIGEESFQTEVCGKKMIEDFMQQRRLRMSYEMISQDIGRTMRVPHPKWPDDRLKDTDFVCCTSPEREAAAAVSILCFFAARNIKKQTDGEGNELAPIPAFRQWARKVTRSFIKSDSCHPDDKVRFIPGVLKRWRNFITINECKKPPFPEIPKDQQLKSSYGWKGNHMDYIGPHDDPNLPVFNSEKEFVDYLHNKGFFRLWAQGKPRQRIKTKRLHTLTRGRKQRVKKSSPLELLQVTPTMTKDGILYRWDLPAKRGHCLVTVMFDVDDLDEYDEDISRPGMGCFDQIKTKYESDCADSKPYKDIFVCKKRMATYLKVFDDDEYENFNKRGHSWKRAYKAMRNYATVYKGILKLLKAMDDFLYKLDNLKPQLVISETTGAWHFLQGGKGFEAYANYLIGHCIAWTMRIHGLVETDIPEAKGIDPGGIDSRVHCMLIALGLHDDKTMGNTVPHSIASMATWIKNVFSKNDLVKETLSMIYCICAMKSEWVNMKDEEKKSARGLTVNDHLTATNKTSARIPPRIFKIIKIAVHTVFEQIQDSYSQTANLRNIFENPVDFNKEGDAGGRQPVGDSNNTGDKADAMMDDAINDDAVEAGGETVGPNDDSDIEGFRTDEEKNSYTDEQIDELTDESEKESCRKWNRQLRKYREKNDNTNIDADDEGSSSSSDEESSPGPGSPFSSSSDEETSSPGPNSPNL